MVFELLIFPVYSLFSKLFADDDLTDRFISLFQRVNLMVFQAE